ncbi:MAG TPA: DUF1887 family CARF protein [Methylococcus sp.]|nr:DUF1887 family CARF protein [Methylococcus sp.]
MNELFGWSEATWHLIDQIGILLGLLMGVSWIVGLPLALLKREDIRRWFTRNRFPNVGAELENALRWDALAFTVSHKELPLWVIGTLKPTHIGLIATEASRDTAREIDTYARQRGIDVLTAHLADPDDPAEARAQTRLILTRLREAGAERIAVDITGGKTPMSLGAFMAAEELGVSSLYVTSDYDAALRRPDMRTAKIHCISKPE